MASALHSAPPALPIAQFSVEQYHRMVESGAFSEDDRLELIEGWVVRKMAKGPGHEYTTGRLEEFLRDELLPGWHVRNQAPITLSRSEPEPDLSVVRGSRADYRDHHPSGTDVALVVEVSDTTLATDRLKGATYGGAGIPQYWVVNLPERCVEVYTGPDASHETGYASRTVLYEHDELRLVLADQPLGTLRISQLLP